MSVDEFVNPYDKIPECMLHNWWLERVEGPAWNCRLFWRCLKCDADPVTRANKPPNYPYTPPCEKLSRDIDTLQYLKDCWIVTSRCIMNGDLIARSIWTKLESAPTIEQNLLGMNESQILAIADRLLTAKCDVKRHRCITGTRDKLIVTRPDNYAAVPAPW